MTSTARLYRAGAYLFAVLPPRLGRVVGLMGGLAFDLSRSRRAVVAANLAHVLPEANRHRLNATTRHSFASYGIYWADAGHLDAIARRRQSLSFSIEGIEWIDEAIAEGHGLVLALPHIGCWEYGGLFLARRGIELTTIAEVLQPRGLFEWFAAERERLGLHVLPPSARSVAKMLAALRSGSAIALLADRDVSGDGIAAELFGSTTRLPPGPALLALRTGAHLLPCAIYHARHGHHHAVVLPRIPAERRGQLHDDVCRVTTMLAQSFETLIARAPEQWHVFQPYWSPETPTAA